MRRKSSCKPKKENEMNDLQDPLAIARALGVYEDTVKTPDHRIARELTISTVVLILSAYAVFTGGIYVGLLLHP